MADGGWLTLNATQKSTGAATRGTNAMSEVRQPNEGLLTAKGI